MEVPKEGSDKPMEEPQKTPPTFRATSPRPNRAKAKYDIMEVMALKDFKPADIVALSPSNLGTKQGKVTVTSNGKTIELTLDEAKLLARYMEEYRRDIEASSLLFTGKNLAPHTIDNLVRSMRLHLRKHSVNTIDSLGWLTNNKATPRIL